MHQHVSDEPSQPQRPTLPEAVYFFRSGLDPSLFKVGRSRNPAKRLVKLGEIIPGGVSLAHQIATNDGRWLEAWLHRLFEAKRVNGEWYRLGPYDVAEATAVARIDRAPALPQPPKPASPSSRRKSQWPPPRYGHPHTRRERVCLRAGTGRRVDIFIGPSGAPETDRRYEQMVRYLDVRNFLRATPDRRWHLIQLVRKHIKAGIPFPSEGDGDL